MIEHTPDSQKSKISMTAISQFHEATAMKRRILKQGTFNARDAGGYPLENGGWMLPGRLYRSDALSALTADDLAEFKKLDIGTVIDLRDARESDTAPDTLDLENVRYERIPIFEEQLFSRDLTNFPTLLGQYQIIMDEHFHQLVKVLELVSKTADRPVIIHCTAGKDRTGLILALLQSIAGVPTELILKDYGASELILNDQFEERVRALYRTAALPEKILGTNPRHAPPSYLAKTLETMAASMGSVGAFLEANGLSCDVKQRLISAFSKSAEAA